MELPLGKNRRMARPVVVDADRQQPQVGPVELAGQVLQRGHLVDAGWAPGGPEIQKHRVAALGAERDRPPARVGQLKVGRRSGLQESGQRIRLQRRAGPAARPRHRVMHRPEEPRRHERNHQRRQHRGPAPSDAPATALRRAALRPAPSRHSHLQIRASVYRRRALPAGDFTAKLRDPGPALVAGVGPWEGSNAPPTKPSALKRHFSPFTSSSSARRRRSS